jgi:LacI family gluconate utilization system Gnt-I transcriptional repressor
VAVLIPLLSNTLFVDLLDAAQNTLHDAGYQTLIGITHYDAAEEEQLLRAQMQHRPAGVLITGLEHSSQAQAMLARSGTPCVHLMEVSRQAGVYSVGLSQADAGAAMTQHLIDQGHRRIAFAAAQLDPRVMQRLTGWRSRMTQAGLYDVTLEWLHAAPSSLALGARLFEQIMRQSPAVDAIFFCNDDLAQGALLAAQRLGIRVPAQVAIAGFNDLTGSDQMCPPLTTIHTPRREIGASAARMLVQLMNGEPVAQPALDLGYRLMIRDSA